MMDVRSSEDDIGSIAANGLTLTTSRRKRMSMDQYYIAQPLHPVPLPEYDAIFQAYQQRVEVEVQPREDEGNEKLPAYSSDINLENVFTRKMELEGAVHRAEDRNWNRVFVTLQGTALSIHKYKSSRVFGSRPEFLDDCPDLPVEGKKAELLRSYNLLYADAGIAADYTKKNHVIRIRAESDQFLLSCQRIETFVHWLHALSTAIDLALPLDERELPPDLSVPRHQRRFESSPRSSPDLGMLETSGRERSDTVTSRPRFDDPSPAERVTSVPVSIRPGEPGSTRGVLRQRPQKPSISPETGKWQPEHGWSARKDMIYAKHCMAILLAESPRKWNLVIMNGKQWAVDWATGVLTRCEPPGYEEIDKEVPVRRSKNNQNA